MTPRQRYQLACLQVNLLYALQSAAQVAVICGLSYAGGYFFTLGKLRAYKR